MTPAERKAVSYLVRLACDLYAATMGDRPIYSNREHMREYIGQRIDERLPLLDQSHYLAEVIVAANAREAK